LIGYSLNTHLPTIKITYNRQNDYLISQIFPVNNGKFVALMYNSSSDHFPFGYLNDSLNISSSHDYYDFINPIVDYNILHGYEPHKFYFTRGQFINGKMLIGVGTNNTVYWYNDSLLRIDSIVFEPQLAKEEYSLKDIQDEDFPTRIFMVGANQFIDNTFFVEQKRILDMNPITGTYNAETNLVFMNAKNQIINTVNLPADIKSTFVTEKYIGFVHLTHNNDFIELFTKESFAKEHNL
jgi:hypothetical protein